MKNKIGTFQIGKSGVTPQTINSLNLMLKTHSQIRISVLRSNVRNKEAMFLMADSIIRQLEIPCNYKIIGFTIVLLRAKNPKK